MATTIELAPIGEPVHLPEVPGCRAVSTNVSANGEVIQMWVPAEVEDHLFSVEEEPGWATFPATHTEEPYSATVVISGPAGVRERALPPLAATFPMVQTLPGGEILVVAPRCVHFEDGSHELNARIFGLDGTFREFCLGDGIQHVQTDVSGRIWVGYFDEGVCGNYGWGGSDGPEPLGSAGLVCYDQTGKPTWKFPSSNLHSILDCYALNVSGDCVWACTFTDFPIVRIDGRGEVRAWQTDLRGPTQLVIAENAVVVFGGYGAHATDCVLLKLGKDRAEAVADIKLLLPDSVDLKEARVIGRGEIVHVFANGILIAFTFPSPK